MYASKLAFTALLTLFPTTLFAQDVTVYGGRLLNEHSDHTTITASVGFDLPKTRQVLGMDQIRADFTYGWDSQNFYGLIISGPSMVTSDGPVNSFDHYYKKYGFHIGPSWRVENILGPVDLSIGVQAGILHATHKSVTDPVIGNEYFNRTLKDTNFSYQFPVELEIPVFDRISISARYRPVGIFDSGENHIDHVVEGGIRIRF